ncbi:Zinc finger, RING-type [Sesbania bispinosa]|nr:Zinc finger, RING-type [Sesbania bispinosa]
MANSTDSSGFLGSVSISGYGYGIGIPFVILLLVITLTLTAYFCTRRPLPPAQLRRRPILNVIEPQHVVIGIDEATIKSYPTLLYSEARLKKFDSSAATCCSICLADYKSTDMIRALPDCGHQFHLNCIDPWLRLHPTCPVCRTSPLPTPLSTPLAEVVPLATTQNS